MQRNTVQRQAIRRVIEESGRPLSTAEILDASKDYAPGLGVATVYRAIKSLVDENWLAAVELPGEPPRYERANKHHHHHFHCRQCGRVFEVDQCMGDFARITPRGFVLESHELILRGLCPDCKS